MAADDGLVELRGEVPRDLIDVIDAVAAAERTNRMSVLRSVLREWADREVHRSTLVLRVRRRNGSRPEPDRKQAGLDLE